MAALRVRLARPGDVPALLGPMAEFNAHEEIAFAADRMGPALERLVADPSIGFALVAEAAQPKGDQTLVGYALVTYGFDLEFAGRDAWLTEVWVLPAHRGAGIGRTLVREATRLAAVRGAKALHLQVRPDNAPAIALYATEGFEPVPRGLRTRLITPPELALRPARPSDAPTVWRWCARSDLTAAMMGPPLFPEVPVPTLDEFLADYGAHYFDGSAPDDGQGFVLEVDGEPVGWVNTNEHVRLHDGACVTELDLWLASSAYTGLGYGRRALALLGERLAAERWVDLMFVQPSARNPRAIACYRAAGFAPLGLGLEEAAAALGTEPDYRDAVFMARALSPRGQRALASVGGADE